MVDIPENSKIQSENGIKFEDASQPSVNRTIELPSTPGTYKFDLQSDGKTKHVTVEVQNCTIATIKSVTEVPNGELSKLNETVANDMKRATDIWGSSADTDTTVDQTLTLNLNVNKLHSSEVTGENGVKLAGDLVAVKISLDTENPYKFYENDEDLVAYNKTTGEELPTVTGEKGKSYYVYVDSDYKSSDILLVNTHTTNDMKNEANTDKHGVVTINNNGKIGLRTNNTALGVNMLDESVTNKDVKNNQENNKVLAYHMDSDIRNTINVYAKSEMLKSYKIGDNEGKWMGLHCAIVIPKTENLAPDVTVSNISDSNGIKVVTNFAEDRTVQGKISSTLKNSKKQAIMWVKVPDFTTVNDYKKTYTFDLTYNKNGIEETTTITINIFNAGYTYVKSIEPADEYTKNIMPEGYTISNEDVKTIREVSMNNQYKNYIQTINLNTVVRAATERNIVMENGKTTSEIGLTKPIKLKITYNMPVDLVRYALDEYQTSINKDSGVNNDSNNVENDVYSEYVYFDADGLLLHAVSRYLYNAFGLKDNTGFKGDTNKIPSAEYDNKSFVTIKLTDKSEINANGKNWNIGGYNSLPVQSGKPALTPANLKNVTAMSSWDLATQLVGASNVSGTATNSITANNYGKLVVNGKEGNWVLCYVKIPQTLSSRVSISDNKSSVYVDKDDASALFGVTTTQEGSVNYDVVPMWFNLNDMGFDAEKTEEEQQLTTIVKFELTNSKTGATEYVDKLVTITITVNS